MKSARYGLVFRCSKNFLAGQTYFSPFSGEKIANFELSTADTQRKTNTKGKNDKAALSDKIIKMTLEIMIKNAMRPTQATVGKLKSECVNTKALKDEIAAMKAELIHVSESQNFIGGKHNDLVEDCNKVFLILQRIKARFTEVEQMHSRIPKNNRK